MDDWRWCKVYPRDNLWKGKNFVGAIQRGLKTMRELIFIRINKNPQASTQTQCQWRQRKVQLGTACSNKSKKTTKMRRADLLKPVRRRDTTPMCMCYEVKDRLIHPSSGRLIFCTIVSEIPDVIFDRVVQKSCKALDTVCFSYQLFLPTTAIPPWQSVVVHEISRWLTFAERESISVVPVE